MIQTAIGKVNDLEQNQPLCGNMREYRAGPRTPRLFKPINTGDPNKKASAYFAAEMACKLGTFEERNRKAKKCISKTEVSGSATKSQSSESGEASSLSDMSSEKSRSSATEFKEGDKCLSTKGGIGSLSSAEQKSTNSITGTNTTSLQPKDQHGPECGQSGLKTSVSLPQEFKVGDLVQCLQNDECFRNGNFTIPNPAGKQFILLALDGPNRAIFEYNKVAFCWPLDSVWHVETEPQESDGWIEQKDHVHGARLWAKNQKGVWFLDNGLWETSDGPKQYPDWPSCKASIEKAAK